MAVREIVLNYDRNNSKSPFGPSPRRIGVAPGDVIQFRIGDTTLEGFPGCRLRISLHHPNHFSKSSVSHGKDDDSAKPLEVKVVADSPAVLAADATDGVISGYKCELLDKDGNPMPGLSADGASGGDIVPGGVAGVAN